MSIIRPVDGMPIAEEHFEALQAVVHASDKKNVPATMTISSLGGSCMISPGVSNCRAVSDRETIRCPSQGDNRCPA